MRVELLGPVRVDGDVEALTRRDRVALSVLAVRRDDVATVDHIAGALWNHDPPASRVKIVQGCVSRLRKQLGADAIETLPDGYRLALAGDDLDVDRFERLVGRARDLLELGEPDPASHALEEALALWAGDPLRDLDDWEHGRAERQRLLELHDVAEELQLEAVLRAGRPSVVLPRAARLVEAQPLREARWALLARAQYQSGRQAEALATLDKARDVLAEQLGLDASPMLDTLRTQVLRHDDALAVPDAPSVVSSRCPYPGLTPFDELDAEEFFGRGDEVEECLARLGRDGVVVVAGPSGSGKSSLVRAGIAARCRREGRDVHVVVAGDHLADDLRRIGRRRPEVLVVDQLEVLTTARVSDRRRTEALDAVADHLFSGWLVLAVRADRLGELAAGPLAGIVERGLFLLRPMDERALRRAIVGPAERAGLLVEPGLVELLVGEVADEPGALPLLAHALRSTWERREGRTLTVAGYSEAGGVHGAIAQTAETVHDRLDHRARGQLHELLLRMAVRTGDGGLVATPVDRDALPSAISDEVVEQLVDARLLTVDGDRLRLAHEALVRAWPRLHVWLDEDVAGQRILRHLSVAARAWHDLGRPDSELYRGVRLAEVVAWHDRTDHELTATERDFLAAGVARRDAERRATAEREERRVRTTRRLRRLLRGVAALSVVALVAGALAAGAAARARGEALAADARRVGAQALLTDRIDTSLLLAAAAVELDPSPDTRASLLTALGRAPQLQRVVVAGGGPGLDSLEVSPDGEILAVAGPGVGTRFVERATGRQLPYDASDWMGFGEGDLVSDRVAFHPGDGPIAHGAVALDRATLTLLDPDTLDEIARLGIPAGRNRVVPLDLAYSPDGGALAAVLRGDEAGNDPPRNTEAAAEDSSFLAVWRLGDLDDPAAVVDLPLHTRSVVWSPDGTALVTATDATALGAAGLASTTVWDADDLSVRTTVEGLGHPVAVSPDGTAIAGMRVEDGEPAGLVTVSATSGRERRRLARHDGPLRDVRYSPDGRAVLSTGGSSAILHDAVRGRSLEVMDGHGSGVASAAFVAHGEGVITVGDDGAVLAWDAGGERPVLDVEARAGRQPALSALAGLPVLAAPSPDGRTVAYAGAAPSDVPELHGPSWAAVQMLDVTTGDLTEPEQASTTPWVTVHWVDADTAVTHDPVGRIASWDAATGERTAERWLGIDGTTSGIIGEELAIVFEEQGALYRVDLDGLRLAAPFALLPELTPTAELRSSQLALRPLAASSDGRTFATFGTTELGTDLHHGVPTGDPLPSSDHLLVLDVDGTLRATIALGFDGSAATFDPSGRFVAVGGREGQVAVVDTDTRSVLDRPRVGHVSAVRSVTWTPDGTVVASGGEDGRVALWDGRTADPLGSVAVTTPGTVAYVATTTDGEGVLVATTAGEVFTLDTRLETWLDAACAIAARELTREEWSAVAGDRSMPTVCAEA